MSWLSKAFDRIGEYGTKFVKNIVGDRALEESERNRMWQERLSSTAHAREVADLAKSGLNPILSMGGKGASSPTGGIANMPQSGGTVSSALGLLQQRLLIKSQAKKAGLEAKLQEGMWNFLDDHPDVADAVYSGMLGKIAGVPLGLGTLYGGAGTGKEKFQEKVVPKVGKYVDKAGEAALQRWFETMNAFNRGTAKRIKQEQGREIQSRNRDRFVPSRHSPFEANSPLDRLFRVGDMR